MSRKPVLLERVTLPTYMRQEPISQPSLDHDEPAPDVSGNKKPGLGFLPIADPPWASATDDAADLGPTVFVVDPDEETAAALGNLAGTLNLGFEIFGSGQEFLAAHDPVRTGCILSELRLPGLSGMQILEHLNRCQSTLPVIFLTSQISVSTAVRLMRSGAMTVLEKPFREHEVWDAVSEAVEVSRRRRQAQFQWRRNRVLLESLTEKEVLVLSLLMAGKPKKAIAKQIGVCIRTVEMRRNQIMEKLQVGSSTELVRFVMTTQADSSMALDYRDSHRPVGKHAPWL